MKRRRAGFDFVVEAVVPTALFCRFGGWHNHRYNIAHLWLSFEAQRSLSHAFSASAAK
jgi:hypothetical protein